MNTNPNNPEWIASSCPKTIPPFQSSKSPTPPPAVNYSQPAYVGGEDPGKPMIPPPVPPDTRDDVRSTDTNVDIPLQADHLDGGDHGHSSTSLHQTARDDSTPADTTEQSQLKDVSSDLPPTAPVADYHDSR